MRDPVSRETYPHTTCPQHKAYVKSARYRGDERAPQVLGGRTGFALVMNAGAALGRGLSLRGRAGTCFESRPSSLTPARAIRAGFNRV